MLTKEEVNALHDSGWNCAQSVLASACEDYGLDSQTAYRLAAFFGGGMRRGEMCGAVTGALMALGLKYGDENNRQKLNSLKFLNAFQNEFGSCICRELIPDGMKKKELCPILIQYAAEYLEKEGKEE